MTELNSTGTATRPWAAGDELLAVVEGGLADDALARLNSLPQSFIVGLEDDLADKADDGHGHSDATPSVPGFMSAVDKTKLDAVPGTIGDVSAAATFAADNALIRSDGTAKGVKGSVIRVSDAGEIDFPVVASPATPAAGRVSVLAVDRPGGAWPAFVSQDGIVQDFDWDQVKTDVSLLSPIGNGSTITLLGCAMTGTGSVTSANMADTTVYTRQRKVEYLVTVAAANAIAGLRMSTAQWSVGGNVAGRGGFRAFICGAPATGVATTTHRFFMGMWGASGPTDVEPSSLTSIVGVGNDAADSNMQFMHNNASGVCTKIDLGSGFPVPTADRTNLYELELYSPPGTTQSVSYRLLNRSTGAVASGTVTTNLPAATDYLTPHIWASVGGTSSVIGVGIGKIAALVVGKS